MSKLENDSLGRIYDLYLFNIMRHRIIKSLTVLYTKITTSIAFIPALVAITFLILSFTVVQFDFSESGKAIKSNAHWLTLKDASTARSIISTITGGLISLTVFSFSMVMILLNQAASQMSNRILDKLIGNRFQQLVLGFYIGTIVYALFLLSTIRDINSGIYVPAISTYLLIAFTVIDIFLFIYFLHFVTQSVKYETIIQQISDATQKAMEKSCLVKEKQLNNVDLKNGKIIRASKSGIFQGFLQEPLISLCEKEDLKIHFHHFTGTMVLKGNPLLTLESKNGLSKNIEEDLQSLINIHGGQDIKTNYYYGFRQLMEVAVKALSPGINDPGTAILSLHALTNLLAIRLQNFPSVHLKDQNNVIRIITEERSFKDIFQDCIYPIWDYGKTDRLVLKELISMLGQLQHISDNSLQSDLLLQSQRLLSHMDQ